MVILGWPGAFLFDTDARACVGCGSSSDVNLSPTRRKAPPPSQVGAFLFWVGRVEPCVGGSSVRFSAHKSQTPDLGHRRPRWALHRPEGRPRPGGMDMRSERTQQPSNQRTVLQRRAQVPSSSRGTAARSMSLPQRLAVLQRNGESSDPAVRLHTCNR